MTTSPARMRRLFLEPEASYPISAAARLLGMKVRELRDWIGTGEIESTGNGDSERLPWSEVVAMAMEFWPQEELEQALGDDITRVMPELVRLAELHVLVPRFEVVGMEQLAAREGTSVDDLVSRQLLDAVSAEGTWLIATVPGFGEAMRWPVIEG
jgi:hypothetical protein